VGAVSVRIQEPVFESQTKTKLGTDKLHGEEKTMKQFLLEFVKENLDNYLHKNPQTAEALLKRILQSERERKEIAGIKKLANERAKKANIHNKKLRDCKRMHFNDLKKLLTAFSLLCLLPRAILPVALLPKAETPICRLCFLYEVNR
jgi:topoisomerase-4 subunit B